MLNNTDLWHRGRAPTDTDGAAMSGVPVLDHLPRSPTFYDCHTKITHQTADQQSGGEVARLVGTPHAEERSLGPHEGGAFNDTDIHDHDDTTPGVGDRGD